MKQLNAIAVAFAIAVAGVCPTGARAQDQTTEQTVRLVPVVDRLHLVTDINVVGDWVYICTQPGVLMRKNLASSSTHDASVFLDIRPKVGTLGARIPSLPGLGYATPGTSGLNCTAGSSRGSIFRCRSVFRYSRRSARPSDMSCCSSNSGRLRTASRPGMETSTSSMPKRAPTSRWPSIHNPGPTTRPRSTNLAVICRLRRNDTAGGTSDYHQPLPSKTRSSGR